MRGKYSSSKSRNGGLEFEKLEKSKEPQLSGAYIRSLVKQLTSSRTKDSSSLNEHENLEGEGISGNPSLCDGFTDQKQEISSNQGSCRSSCDGFSHQKQEKSHPTPQQHKKQVRRRLHASRPYQERLLNMAEARREIVTALKFHRAAMKQASEKQQQQSMELGPENQLFEAASHHLCIEQETKLKYLRNPRIYASNSSVPNIPANYMDNISYSPGYCCPYSWSDSPLAPPPLVQENLNFALPSQPLGLNLNLQDFSNLDIASFNRSTNPVSIFSYSSASTSSSPVSANTDENPSLEAPLPSVAPEGAEYGGHLGLHPAMDDKEIAEIRSIGEQYEMEWNDTLNLVNSAWWFKFLKETDKPENQEDEYFMNSPFDEVMEFPAWLNANESCFAHVNDHCSDDYFQDPALPCMDIEEIEGMDGDWLA